MFHELLMALNGCPGSIFCDSPEGLKVTSNIPNLHPAEKSILQQLCVLGSKYKLLQKFVKKYKYNTIAEKDDVHGLYLETFCYGLDSVLEVYYNELIDIEKELLNDPFLPLSHFLKLEKYLLLFQVLSSMVSEIVNYKVHGCRILELLYKQSFSGVTLIESSMNKVLQKCHSVMFKQVFCWMMNGYVEDPYLEFFIQPNASVKSAKEMCLKSSRKEPTSEKYIVKPELLPSYIPCSLAEKILFVGEYVSVLGETGDSDAYALFLKKEHIFVKKFEKLLEKPVFSLLSFETTVDDIRRCAAEHLWKVIVKGANVVHHLKIMKEFYLLGRGELFLNFIGEVNHLLKMPVTINAESDANKIFLAVARQTLPDDDSITEKFRIVLRTEDTKNSEVDRDSLSKAKLVSGWSSIGLIYDVPHPLHILITPSIIERYNTVFRFLLSVRKVQIELHQCWALQMRSKGSGYQSSFVPLWELRSHMSFLIDNFQYYVLVDVLESCFSNLIEKMENVQDFEEIQQFHDRFLSSITSQCFLELWTVFHPLNQILDMCTSLCSLMNRINMNFSQREISQFESLKLNFQRQTALLFRVLSNVRSHQVSPHLAQLLLRIDYNKYLSSCGSRLGGTPDPWN